jgi:excisionase family DNA binding protein
MVDKSAVFLTIGQVADRLQVSKDTVRALIRTGQLKSVRVGVLYRIRESALEEYLAYGQQ